MIKSESLQKNNKGFTLVELIVVILMIGLISGILVTFIMVSMKSFSSVSAEVKLQTEADYAVNFLNDKCMEALAIYSFADEKIKDENGDECNVTIIACLTVSREVNALSNDYRYYFAIFDEKNRALRTISCPYSAFEPVDAAGNCGLYFGSGAEDDKAIEKNVIGNKRLLLAENVSGFTLQSPENGDYKYVKAKIDFAYDGYNYTINKVITKRN